MGWKISALVLAALLLAEAAHGQPSVKVTSTSSSSSTAGATAVARGTGTASASASATGGSTSSASASAGTGDDDEPASSEEPSAPPPKPKKPKEEEEKANGKEEKKEESKGQKVTEVDTDGENVEARSEATGEETAQATAVARSGPAGAGGYAGAVTDGDAQEVSEFKPKPGKPKKEESEEEPKPPPKKEKKKAKKKAEKKKAKSETASDYGDLDICTGLSKFVCCDDKTDGESYCGCWGEGRSKGSCNFKVLQKENPRVIEDLAGFEQGTRCRCPVAGVDECFGLVKVDCCNRKKSEDKCRCLFGTRCLYEKVSDDPLVWKDVGFNTGECQCT